MPRLTIFLPDLDCGGAQRVLLTLAEGFIDRGLAVDLILARAGGLLEGDIPPRVNVLSLSNGTVGSIRLPFSAVIGLTKYLRQRRPNAILSSVTGANIVAVIARWLAGQNIKLVLRHENTAANLEGVVRPWLVRHLYPFADAIIAISSGAADDLQRGSGISPQKVKVIANPIDSYRIRERSNIAPSHAWFRNRSTPVILAVGRLSPQKDFTNLINALALARRERELRLVILGEGPERAGLESLAKDLQISDDIWMPGVIQNPYPFMRAADVFVLSSRWEGLPIALMESMALGSRIVSTDCHSGPRELLDSGRFGQLVPVANPERLAAAILRSLHSTHDREAIMNRANLYSPEYAVNQHLALLGLLDDGSDEAVHEF